MREKLAARKYVRLQYVLLDSFNNEWWKSGEFNNLDSLFKSYSHNTPL